MSSIFPPCTSYTTLESKISITSHPQTPCYARFSGIADSASTKTRPSSSHTGQSAGMHPSSLPVRVQSLISRYQAINSQEYLKKEKDSQMTFFGTFGGKEDYMNSATPSELSSVIEIYQGDKIDGIGKAELSENGHGV